MADDLDAFLAAHAQPRALPASLYAGGEALWQRLHRDPPRDARWGRFLVAMGETASERMHDDAAAAMWFRRCLDAEDVHRDAEACVAAGHGQAVLWERSGEAGRAEQAYRAAAEEGFRCAAAGTVVLRAACAAIRLEFARSESLSNPGFALAKRTWLAWTRLHVGSPGAVEGDLADQLGLQLCSFLLPEDDPTLLAAAWRQLAPHELDGWRDASPACLRSLYELAAAAADRHLRDEGEAPGQPYRLLAAAVRP
ncbi:MAG: hypothetical protein J0M02_07210 [Planctomycetes bacterium]|nr:hypothetical protein [Planctomycetota bacterium]